MPAARYGAGLHNSTRYAGKDLQLKKLNLKKFANPIDSKIERQLQAIAKQKQTIVDHENVLEYMVKELERLEKLKQWAKECEEK